MRYAAGYIGEQWNLYAATQSSPPTYLECDAEHTTKSKHNLKVYTDLHREE